ncbi:hypothetical protein LTR94_028007, partial [Friedmanniomyces endolithicus]
ALRNLRCSHRALRALPDEKNAWHFDGATLHEYLPDLEECSSLPPLTLVPVEQFAREVDDVARHGMEYGFMDIAGLCPLPDAARVTDWFASLEAGARLLLAAQELIQLDPDTLGTRYGAPGQDGRAFASLHHIEHDDDAGPRIAAGTPLTRAHLRQWSEALGRAAAPELLPHNVLVAHQDLLAWWIPAEVRPAYFNLSTPLAGLKALSTRTVVSVPYPAHLLVATKRSLGVYALREDERPTADSIVFHSPILNVYADGTLCWGNIPKPGTLSVSAIPDFERALFESWSTHPNHVQYQT